MTQKKSERMVKFTQLIAIVVAVVGLGFVANPSALTQWVPILIANEVAWIGLALIILGIYIFKKSG